MKKRFWDILLIGGCLLMAAALFLFSHFGREAGAGVIVRVEGEEVTRYGLYDNGTYPLNGGTNTLTVKDGIAYMSYSECKGHQCEKMGKIRYVGEFIECAPNLIKIVITGESDDAVDFVS